MEVSFRGQQKGLPVELGNWGYATAALQVIGFALGGVATFAYLVSLPYCERCSKYLKAKAKQIRYVPENFSETVTGILASIDGDRFQEAFDSHSTFGSDQNPKDGYLRSQLEWKQCPACKINWLGFSAQKLAGDDWQDIKGGSYARFSQSELRSK